MLVTAKGRDRPGLTNEFLQVISKSDDTALLDISQLEVHGLLILSLLLKKVSEDLVKDLLLLGKRLDLALEFRDVLSQGDGLGDDSSQHLLRVQVVLDAASQLCAPLLQSVASVITSSDLNIETISDELGCNEPFGASVTFVVSPVRPSDRTPALVEYLRASLTAACKPYQAFVAVQPFDPHEAPQGKGLLIFGLSEVLVRGDVLDMLVDASSSSSSALRDQFNTGAISYSQFTAARFAALAGHSSHKIESEILNRIEFVPGARETIRFLRFLGYKLAVVTSTATSHIAQTVKRRLGLDYALATEIKTDEHGNFSADFGDINDTLRKIDLIRLLASREGVNERNIVLVGDYPPCDQCATKTHHTCTALSTACGSCIFFNAAQTTHPDLRLITYLMGYSAENFLEVQNRNDSCRDSLNHPVYSARPIISSQAVIVKIMGPDKPGQLAAILRSIGRAKVGEIFQSKVKGVLCAGIRIFTDSVEETLKELLYTCHSLGLSLDYQTQEPAARISEINETLVPSKSRRLIVTASRLPSLTASELSRVVSVLSVASVNIITFRKLAKEGLSALEMSVSCPHGLDTDEIRRRLLDVTGVDLSVQADSIDRVARRLIVFDMDSTLIQQEVIDELGKLAGVGEGIAAITERAMRGELDFFASLQERVALLKGHSAEQLFAQVQEKIQLTNGAARLCARLKELGFKMAVISGGFLPVAKRVQATLGLDYAFANELEVDADGTLTGKTVGPIVTPERKRSLMRMIAEVEGCSLNSVIAVGDGANDIPMLQAAGLGVAFCAKPKVQQQTNFRVNVPDLTGVAYLLGLTHL